MKGHRVSTVPSSRTSRSIPLPALAFPRNSHLLITTSHSVTALSQTSLRKVFMPSEGGIVAATELHNGLLAVADGKIVLLSRNGVAKRQYRLRGGDGDLAILKQSKHGQELLFTTSLNHGIHCYSIPRNHVEEFGLPHPSRPTAMAISTNFVYMISASATPPVIYLRTMASPTKHSRYMCPSCAFSFRSS